jgi:hypothetical protein
LRRRAPEVPEQPEQAAERREAADDVQIAQRIRVLVDQAGGPGGLRRVPASRARRLAGAARRPRASGARARGLGGRAAALGASLVRAAPRLGELAVDLGRALGRGPLDLMGEPVLPLIELMADQL